MRGTVPKIFLTAAIILAIYEMALRLAAPAVDSSQDQYTTNAIRLENYVDARTRVNTVVVGSSLVARIPAEAWPRDWHVLAQAGGSSQTGLAVVATTPPLPRRVLVEANFLYNDADNIAVGNATGARARIMRQTLWLTRQAYRPMNIFVWALRKLRPEPVFEAQPGNFQQLLAVQQKDDAVPPLATTRAGILRAKALIDGLKAMGVEVALFQMPVDASLEPSPFMRGVRAIAEKAFPQGRYCWLSVENDGEWKTVDGIHLVVQDGRRAAADLASASCQR